MIYDCCALAQAYRDSVMSTAVRIVTPSDPLEEPITLEEAWQHLRIDTYGSPLASDDDPWLENIGIPAARMWAEGYTGLSLAPQTLELVTNAFPADYFELPFGPVQYVESISYTDADDVEQTFTDYELNTYLVPARLSPAYDFTWPTARDSTNSVRVRYVAGYSLPGYSPAGFVLTSRLKIGMLLMLGHLYENREDTTALRLELIPNGAKLFLDFDRTRRGFA